MGGGGSSGACDAVPILSNASKCGASACHGSTIRSGGLDLVTASVADRLLGVMSTGENGSACGSHAEPYLVVGSDPARGLLIDKLQATPPCGVLSMAALAALSATEIECIGSWATSLTRP